MTTSKVLKRLLHVLNIEEEMRRRELESAQSELTQFERSLVAALEREKKGRRLLVSSVDSADLDGRVAASEEIRSGHILGSFLHKHIEQLALLVEERRRTLREKQIERKQTETLVIAAAAEQALEENRKSQQSLDQWFLTRLSGDRTSRKNQEREELDAHDPDGGSAV